MRRARSAGDIVETNCTKCRALMNHTIVAMVGEQIVKVECNTCRSTHKYHPPKEAKAPAAPRASRAVTATASRKEKRDPAAEAAAEWDALQESIDPGRAVPYDMNATYRVRNLVSHPLFGLGVVQKIVSPNKMEVLFRAGRKLLRCG